MDPILYLVLGLALGVLFGTRHQPLIQRVSQVTFPGELWVNIDRGQIRGDLEDEGPQIVWSAEEGDA